MTASSELTTTLLCLCGLTRILFHIISEANYFISSLTIMVYSLEICFSFLKISQYYNPTPQFQQSIFTIIKYAAGAHISLVVLEKSLSYLCGCKIFKSWKMMLWKCCTQYASKFGKLSSGHRTGKISFHSNPKERQCQRMLKLPHNCTHLTC